MTEAITRSSFRGACSVAGPKILRSLVDIGFDPIEVYKRFRSSRRGTEAERAFVKKKPTFWLRNDLQFVLKDARDKYLEAVKQHHPDRGGEHERMTKINEAWEFIQRAFAKKGITL